MFLFFCTPAFANNLVISNVTLEDRNSSANTMVVQFDISWDHSFRLGDGERDAAWVFVKIYQNTTAPWIHGKLYTSGTNPNDAIKRDTIKRDTRRNLNSKPKFATTRHKAAPSSGRNYVLQFIYK